LGGTLGSGISGQSAAGLGFGGGFAQLGGHLGLQGRSQLGGFGMQGGVWQEGERVHTRLQDKVGDKVQSEQSRTSVALRPASNVVTEQAAGALRPLLPIIDGQEHVLAYAYAINGQLQGAELYSSGRLFRKLWPKLLHANTVEAVAKSREKTENP